MEIRTAFQTIDYADYITAGLHQPCESSEFAKYKTQVDPKLVVAFEAFDRQLQQLTDRTIDGNSTRKTGAAIAIAMQSIANGNRQIAVALLGVVRTRMHESFPQSRGNFGDLYQAVILSLVECPSATVQDGLEKTRAASATAVDGVLE